MKRIIISLMYLSCIFINIKPGFAQCSDAGACQVGHLSGDDSKKLQFALSYGNGYSGKEDDVSFNSFQLKTHYEIFDGSRVTFIIPYNYQSGPLGDTDGLGDLIFSWMQNFNINDNSSLNASVGVKFATGNENEAPHLPQIYQPGLGTTDFIFTLDYLYDDLSIGLGYQLAGGRNEKDGLRLKRGDDFIARVIYNFLLDELLITPQLLFIQRISESSIIDTSSAQENFINVDKSNQPQLNFVLRLGYPLNENISLFAEGAIPFLEREINIDGLKRAYTISAGINLYFN